MEILLTTDFFKSPMIAFNIKTPTATLIPEKAFCTIIYLEKFCKKEAITKIITKEGNTTPKVANKAPHIPLTL